ncbi:MAG: cytochrome bd-I oxidase subunit CydX [Lysobacterales bacterium CG_4_10_14_3_um_filter_64_11]|nr:MAG: cytochrome bd-I oxidase subunit CydX [Xanthomonadales bacterium CG_4_10_14_3_um_filter_64_11]
MWYFTWILGLALACSVGILNAIWYEVQSDRARGRTGPFKRP